MQCTPGPRSPAEGRPTGAPGTGAKPRTPDAGRRTVISNSRPLHACTGIARLRWRAGGGRGGARTWRAARGASTASLLRLFRWLGHGSVGLLGVLALPFRSYGHNLMVCDLRQRSSRRSWAHSHLSDEREQNTVLIYGLFCGGFATEDKGASKPEASPK